MKQIVNMFGFTFVLLLLITLTSCEQTNTAAKPERADSAKEQASEKLTFSFKHPQTDQTYKIVNANKLFNNYINTAEKNPNDSQLDLYKEEVIEPIYNDCFNNGEYLHMVDSVLNEAPEHFTEIQKIIAKIDSEETNKIIKEALVKSSELLPSEQETTVCIFPSTKVNSPLMVTAGSGKIIVLFNMYYTQGILQASIAHEYHHSVWTEKHFNEYTPFSVLDNLIFEGKAVMFEKLVFPEITVTPVDLTYSKGFWSKIESDLETYDFNRSSEIIMGGKELPSLYGYSEGYKMVKSYLDLHPNTKPEDWTAMSAKDIFEKGNYIDNYK